MGFYDYLITILIGYALAKPLFSRRKERTEQQLLECLLGCWVPKSTFSEKEAFILEKAVVKGYVKKTQRHLGGQRNGSI